MLNVYRALLLQDGQTVSLAKLLVRLAFGIGIALHGMGKLETPMMWMGPDSPIPGFLQAAAAFSEVGGGLAFALGLLSPFASLSLVGVMIGALGIVHLPNGDPYVSPTGGGAAELATLYLTVALLGFVSGPGKFSIDYLLFAAKNATSRSGQSLSNS